MSTALSRAALRFSALGDEHRLALLHELRSGPRPAGELGGDIAISRPAVSRHLRVLREADLVVCTRNGTRRLYAIRPDAVDELRSELDGMWSDALARFQRFAERAAE